MLQKNLKKESSILISIVIPTKNRYNTLIPVIQSILNSTNFPNFEIVIQDNSEDNSSFLTFLDNNYDNKIKYYYNENPIPISDNTELAVHNSKGEYLIFIGDDDFVSPNIFDVTLNLKEQNISCLIYECGYYWWDTVSFSSEDYYHKPNNLWIPKNISMDLIKMDTKIELNKALAKGAVSYYSLPRFYHGIVTRKVLDQIKENTGQYLVGSCPDISLAVSLSYVIDDYYYMRYPISIFGASKNSGGGWTASKSHFGKIEDMKFLRPDIVDKWDDNVPRIWSQKTIYPQTTYEVIKAFNKNDIINYIPLYSAMMVYEPFLYKYTYKTAVAYCNADFKRYFQFFFSLFKKISGNLIKKIKTLFKSLNYEVYQDVNANKLIEILKNIK